MAYILNWSSNSKGTIVLNPVAVDTTSTSITLFGKGAPNYGEGQQESILKILESFSNTTAPLNPTHGQIWFNTTDRIPYIYDIDNTWKPIGNNIYVDNNPPSYTIIGLLWWEVDTETLWVWDGSSWKKASGEIVPVAYLEEYNALVDLYNKIAGAPTGPLGSGCATSFGYGQNNLPYLTSMTNLDWLDLLNRFRNVANHQGESSANISTRGFIYDYTSNIQCGIVTLLNEYNNTQINVNNLLATRFQASALESSSTGGTVSVSGVWNTDRFHEVFVQFTDTNHLKSFFNAGGKIQIYADLDPLPPIDQTNTNYDNQLAAIGTINITSCNTTAGVPGVGIQGFYNMTTIYQIYFESYVNGNTGEGGYRVECRIEGDKDIRIAIHFNMPNDLYVSGSIAGTITSTVNSVKASELYLNDPEIAFPIMSSVTSL